MKGVYFVSVLMGLFVVSGCATYNTYAGADVTEAGRLIGAATVNLGSNVLTADDSIIGIVTPMPVLHASYGIKDIVDISMHGNLFQIGGQVRGCIYRSEKRMARHSSPYWVATVDIGGVLGSGFGTGVGMIVEQSYTNVVFYPGITFGAVGSNLEGYGRIRYYRSLYYSKGLLIDPHLGIGGGLNFEPGQWKGLLGGVINLFEFTLVVGRFNENDHFMVRGFDVGVGTWLQF